MPTRTEMCWAWVGSQKLNTRERQKSNYLNHCLLLPRVCICRKLQWEANTGVELRLSCKHLNVEVKLPPPDRRLSWSRANTWLLRAEKGSGAYLIHLLPSPADPPRVPFQTQSFQHSPLPFQFLTSVALASSLGESARFMNHWSNTLIFQSRKLARYQTSQGNDNA